MKLLPRKNSGTPDDVEGPEIESDAVRGKGRPTPKRREVVTVRGPVSAPKTRKEASARQKQLARQSRGPDAKPGVPQTAGERRTAIRSGQVLARRDQGHTRALARDFVDSRKFLLSNYLLLAIVLMVVAWISKSLWPQLLAFAVFLACIVEWFWVGTKVRKLAVERHGRAEGSPASIGFYAGSRAYLPRRWRIPAPRVDKGDDI